MALVSCDFFSEVLGLSMSMTVILPQSTSGQIGMAGIRRAVHKSRYCNLSTGDRYWDESARRPETFELAFGTKAEFDGSENDLVHLARKLSESGRPKPRMYQCCGTEDFLYDTNQRFREEMSELSFDYTYEEEPGEHEWGYWDMKIQRVLEWMGF